MHEAVHDAPESSIVKTRADFAAAKAAAVQLLQEYGLDKPPIDPVYLAQQLGVQVAFVSFDAAMKSVSGFYDAEEACIYVNKSEAPARQTFTVAHELGHHMLHQAWAHSTAYKVLLRDSDAQMDFYEQEANAFAANLLVPRSMLESYAPVATIQELSQLFLVSVPVIRNRLSSEGIRG
jgi:Zn-dependent peptidase ImmA (M78 family)